MNELYYSDGVRWLRLPRWARFFLDLGEALASHISTDKKLIATMAVPTRSYAASLAAFGIALKRASTPAETIAGQEYFQLLIDAEKGTPVTLLRNGVRQKGVTDGHFVANKKMWLRVKVRGGELCAWAYVSEDEASTVQLVSNQEEVVIPKRITGKTVMPLSEFAEALIGPENIATFGAASRCDCVIVGQLASVHPEILDTKFALQKSPGVFSEGSLQDVLRVREFLDSGEQFRSVLVSALKNLKPDLSATIPAIVIFDGSTAFLKCRGMFPSANWIVVLDRRDSMFADAMTVCNQDYAKRKSDDISFDSLPNLPCGIELVTYFEMR
jgi:hypothetical protein